MDCAKAAPRGVRPAFELGPDVGSELDTAGAEMEHVGGIGGLCDLGGNAGVGEDEEVDKKGDVGWVNGGPMTAEAEGEEAPPSWTT